MKKFYLSAAGSATALALPGYLRWRNPVRSSSGITVTTTDRGGAGHSRAQCA